MIPGIEEFYQLIASEMVDQIPGPWRQATIEVIYYPSSSDYHGEYVHESGEEFSVLVSETARLAVDELRRKFRDAGQRVWGQFHFKLHADGTFNVKWGYDNCLENGDTIWDPDEWDRRFDENYKRLTRP